MPQSSIKFTKILIFFTLFLVVSIWLIWFYGPNYLLPLPSEPVIKKNAIQMPVGKFFIVKRDKEYAAIRILRLTWDNRAIYECYYQSDGSGNFNSQSVAYQKGEVYERYAKTPISPSEVLLKDKGGKLNIECGSFKIEWSAQNWIYLEGYGIEQPFFEIAPTMIRDISRLDVMDKSLKWISRER